MKVQRGYKLIDQQFNNISSIERKIYQRFNQIQKHQTSNLVQQTNIIQMENQRKVKMASKSGGQIVKHPYNDNFWKRIANVIEEKDYIELNQIQLRKRERERIRYEMQENKKRNNERQTRGDEAEYNEFEQGRTRAIKHTKEQKAPWKLMRELRRKQVQQNKRRLQKIRQNQLQKMSKYHKY